MPLPTRHAPGAPVAADFLAAMEKHAILPLWDRYHDLLPSEPKAPDKPFLWRWGDISKPSSSAPPAT